MAGNSKIATQEVPITVNTSKMSTVRAKCFKRSGWAILFVQNATFVSNGNNQSSLITGLPKAKIQTAGICGGANAGKTAELNNTGENFWISTGETSLNGHIGKNTESHWITLVYMIDE